MISFLSIQLANMNIFLQTIKGETFTEMMEATNDYVECQNREMDEIKWQMIDLVDHLKTCV